MLNDLPREDRLQLMRFVCSFAWADLSIHDGERRYVSELISRLELDEDDTHLVHGWLSVPPEPEDVDPQSIPVEHRQIFLDAMLGLPHGISQPAELRREWRLAILQIHPDKCALPLGETAFKALDEVYKRAMGV